MEEDGPPPCGPSGLANHGQPQSGAHANVPWGSFHLSRRDLQRPMSERNEIQRTVDGFARDAGFDKRPAFPNRRPLLYVWGG
jgi:hypothetical protein